MILTSNEKNKKSNRISIDYDTYIVHMYLYLTALKSCVFMHRMHNLKFITKIAMI